MTTPSVLAAGKLTWAYPDAARPVFVLRADREEIGSLQFEKDAGARSTAELDGRRWTIERTAARYPSVSVRDEASGTAVAQFAPCVTGGGVLTFTDGRRFCWTREHIWSTNWCFRCKENKSLVCVSQEAGPLAGGGRVSVCSDAANLPETTILVLLAWYLRVLEFEKLMEADFVCG